MRIFLLMLLALATPAHALALTIATGSSAGTYFAIAQDIKKIAEKQGLAIEVVQTNGSFDNINLLAEGKVDLAVMQLDVLRLVAEIMRKETGLNVLQEVKVVLNLYLEEIHILTKNPEIRTLSELEGKRVAVGPEKSGSALTAEVLLAGFGIEITRLYANPEDAVHKLNQGEIDALIFVGGAPVPAFQKLDRSFRFVALPADSGLEQIYPKKKIIKPTYTWADEIDTHAVPSVIMTRNRTDKDYVSAMQKLVLLILSQKEYLDSSGHPKWKDSFARSTQDNLSYPPVAEVIHLHNVLDGIGYKVIKK